MISGPSGTGKGAICMRLRDKLDVLLSISMTTRPPRPRESEGFSYYFVSDQKFNEVIAEDGFLEHAVVYGSKYGTPKAPVLKQLEAGRDVILEIDVQGAMQVKRNYPRGVFIYVLPPSMEELRRRIVSRGSESDQDIDLRMMEALGEIDHLPQYDYYIVNRVLNEAVDDVAAIIRAEHAKVGEDADDIIAGYKDANGDRP